MRGYRKQQMNVIRRHGPTDAVDLQAGTGLSDQLAQAQLCPAGA
jgi:hypothetical protein